MGLLDDKGTVLLALAKGPLASFEIAQKSRIPISMLMPILQQLEGKKWVTSELEPMNSQQPRKKLYSITDSGRSKIDV
mgnify:CR=1 FL=1